MLFKLELNSAGIQELLKSQEVLDDLAIRGYAIRDALPTKDGEEWRVNEYIGRDRAQVVVKTANNAARRSAAEDNALIAALSAGR